MRAAAADGRIVCECSARLVPHGRKRNDVWNAEPPVRTQCSAHHVFQTKPTLSPSAPAMVDPQARTGISQIAASAAVTIAPSHLDHWTEIRTASDEDTHLARRRFSSAFSAADARSTNRLAPPL